MISRQRILTIPVLLLLACICTACAGADTPTPAAVPVVTATVRVTDAPAQATYLPTASLPAATTTPAATTPAATAPAVPPTATRLATATTTATATLAPAGGTVRYGLVAPALNLDPVYVETVADRQIARLVWESLLQIDPVDGRLRAGLAQEWAISDDGYTLRFTLVPDALWHDGTPVSAWDVVATLEYLIMPGSRSPWQIDLASVESVTAYGDLDVEILLSEPMCASLYDIGLVPILPAHQLRDLGAPEPGREFVGSGPFRQGEPADNGNVRLFQNSAYRERVVLDELILVPYASNAALHEAWAAGQVDVTHFPAGQGAPADGGVSFSLPGVDYFLLIFNLRRGALMDVEAREALTLALDRESIAGQVSPSGATLLQASLLSDHWALSEADLPAPAYDPMAAGAMLSEAGWADEDGDGWRNKWDTLLSLDVLTNGENPLRMSTAALVAQSFRRIGVESELHVVEWGIFLDLLFRHDFDVAVISWPFPLDPDQSVFWRSSETEAGRGFNFGQWENEDADALLDEAATYPGCDVQGRAALYGEFARLMGGELPIVPLFVPHGQLLVRETVFGVNPGAFAGPLCNAHTWASTSEE